MEKRTNQPEATLLDPQNDWMFRQLFGEQKHKKLVIHLINDVFGERISPVKDVSFVKTDFSGEVEDLCGATVDVLCETDTGPFVVEMQRYEDMYYKDRVVFYSCMAYTTQRTYARKEEAKKKAEAAGKTYVNHYGYDLLLPVHTLSVVGKNTLFEDDVPCVSFHDVRESTTNRCTLRQLSYAFIELKKFRKTLEELETDLDRWIYFFQNAGKIPESELEFYAQGDSAISDAYKALKKGAYTPDQLMAYKKAALEAEAIQANYEAKYQRGKKMLEEDVEGLHTGSNKISFISIPSSLNGRKCHIHFYYNPLQGEQARILEEELSQLESQSGLKGVWITTQDGRRMTLKEAYLESIGTSEPGWVIFISFNLKDPKKVFENQGIALEIAQRFRHLRKMASPPLLKKGTFSSNDGRFFIQFIACILSSPLLQAFGPERINISISQFLGELDAVEGVISRGGDPRPLFTEFHRQVLDELHVQF